MSETTNPRYHDLDAVRALALFLGIVLHGVMSFMEPRFWVVGDAVTTPYANLMFYVIHMFRMVTFFVLAGFFARLLLQRRDGKLGAFLGNRLKRVGIPLAAFWPISIALIITVVILANPAVPGAPPAPPPPVPTLATFPLTHLWFLYVLLLFYVGVVIIKAVTDIARIGQPLGRALDKVVGILTKSDVISAVLALPVAAVFYTNPQWNMWLGILTPDTGLVPNTMALAGYITAFVFGWWLHRRADLLDHLASRFWMHGLAAVAGTWLCLTLNGGAAPTGELVSGAAHPIYCLVYPMTAWSFTLALIGGARVLLRKEVPAIRYFADASYWVYLIHIPVVMFAQYLVKDYSWPVAAKISIVLFGTLVTGLVTYQLFVRYSFIGTILNGRRRKVKAGAAPADEVIA